MQELHELIDHRDAEINAAIARANASNGYADQSLYIELARDWAADPDELLASILAAEEA